MMSQNNLLADLIVRLKNSIMSRSYRVNFTRYSNFFLNILRKLESLGYVSSIRILPKNLEVTISKETFNISFIRHRQSVSVGSLREFEIRLLPSRHRGHLLLTNSNSSEPLITSVEARERGTGGILIAYVY